jgi:dynein heavy chain 1
MESCTRVFAEWQNQFDQHLTILRDYIKGRAPQFRRHPPEHRDLSDRLQQLEKFRQHHEQLHAVITRVLQPSAQSSDMTLDPEDAFAISEVNNAYGVVRNSDPLALSEAGTHAWKSAIETYNERIARVEARIATRMRDQLGSASSATEMFRIFNRFAVLFGRPSIKAAIQDYKSELISRVMADLVGLQRKYDIEYPNTPNSKMSAVRDIPPISGQIVWAMQIEHQVKGLLNRVESVFGKDWDKSPEGEQLRKTGDELVRRINTESIYNNWLQDMKSRELTVLGKVFRISQSADNHLQLQVSDGLGICFDLFRTSLSPLVGQVPASPTSTAHPASSRVSSPTLFLRWRFSLMLFGSTKRSATCVRWASVCPWPLSTRQSVRAISIPFSSR